MATEQQIPVLAARLVEHQSAFSVLSTDDAQWVIQNTKEAITVFGKAIANRTSELPEPIERVRVINATTIMVNLDAPPNLPFDGAKIEFQIGSGWIRVEKRTDGLCMDNRKVVLYLSERQKGGKVIRGHELREELSGKSVLHPNIMDALIEHPSLIPEDWKKDEEGNTRFIFFLAVIFRDADGDLCVRCFYFNGGQWGRNYYWLDGDWSGDYSAALLAR